MDVTRKILHKEEDGTLIELDIGALAANVEESDMRKFVTSDEKNQIAEIPELKKSVSDGKALVAAAITAKEIETAATATFAEMAANIEKIETGGGSDQCTATKDKVLEGNTAITADSGDEAAAGTMKNLTGRTAITHSSDNGTKVILGDAVFVSKNNDGTDRVEIRYNGEKGFIDANTLFAVPLDVMAAALGLTAGDLRTNKQVLGLVGTFTNDAVLDPQYLMEGQSGYDDGVKKEGTLPNLGSYGAQAAGWTQYNGNVYFGFPRGAYYQTYQTGSGGAAECYIPNASLGIDANKFLKGWSIAGVSGALAVQSAISFSAAALSHDTIRISWKNPSKGPWQGVFIQMSTSGSPGTGGGSRVYTGAGNNPNQADGSNWVDITGLNPNTTYYFTCTSYCDNLGWGSSYNVNATTTHMYLYRRGSNVAGFSVYNTTVANAIAFGGNAIIYSDTNGAIISDIQYDLSKYTKLKVRYKVTSSSYSYANMAPLIVADDKAYSLSDATYSLADIGNEREIEFTLNDRYAANWQKTGRIRLFLASARSSTATSYGRISAEIYEIWLE